MMDSAPVHLALKRLVLRSPLGRLAVGTRDAFKLAASAWAGDECLGTLANDQLASLLISGLCQPGARFLDVGAHIGSVVAEVLGRCPGTQVIAIEAMPDKAESLRRMFPGIAVHACAAGDREGEVSFFVDRRQSGFSSLGRPRCTHSAGNVHEIRVPLRRLDDVVGLGAPSIDAMKIDVEGAELGVLRGADQLVETHRPTIMFESGPASERRPRLHQGGALGLVRRAALRRPGAEPRRSSGRGAWTRRLPRQPSLSSADH